VADRQISRYHARLTPTPEGVILEDLGSKNGTHHNGVPLSGPVVLQDGDLVSVALAQQFLFLTSDATMPLLEGAAHVGRLMMDQKSRRVWVNQQQLVPPLSAQQFKMLWLLYESQGQVVSRPDLVAAVWGDEQAAGVSACATASPPSTPPTNISPPCADMASAWIIRPPDKLKFTLTSHSTVGGFVLMALPYWTGKSSNTMMERSLPAECFPS
jgi:hypothetical protein